MFCFELYYAFHYLFHFNCFNVASCITYHAFPSVTFSFVISIRPISSCLSQCHPVHVFPLLYSKVSRTKPRKFGFVHQVDQVSLPLVYVAGAGFIKGERRNIEDTRALYKKKNTKKTSPSPATQEFATVNIEDGKEEDLGAHLLLPFLLLAFTLKMSSF